MKDSGIDKVENYFPEIIHVEITNDCNLHCIMCSRRKMKRKIGYMGFDLYCSIVDQCAEQGRVHLIPQAYGEPLLHRDIFKMISYAKKQGIQSVSITSNALLLDEYNSRGLIESGIDFLSISLDGATKETYEKIRLNASFELARKNILNFFKIRERLNSSLPKTALQMVRLRINQHEIEMFLKEYRDVADIVRINEFSSYGDSVEPMGVEISLPEVRYSCNAMHRNLEIHWDGKTTICYQDFNGEAYVGDLLKESISEIWNGPKRMGFLELDRKGRFAEIPFCSRCKDWYFYR